MLWKKSDHLIDLIKLVFVLLILVTTSILANDEILEKINANNDRGLWLEQNIQKDLKSNWIINLHFEQRWGAHYRVLYHQEYEATLRYDITKTFKLLSCIFKNVKIGPGYNFTRQLQKNIREEFEWVWVRRPLLVAYLESSLSNWTIKQRLRGEYIDFTRKHHKDHGVFRYRLEIYSPWKWTQLKINPYLWNEWFFREDTYSRSNPHGLVGGWHENRLRLGLSFNLFEFMSALLYGQWIARKQKPDVQPSWFNTYQIGFVVNFSF